MLKPDHATDWLTLVIVSYLLLLGILHYYFPKRFNAFIRLPVNNTYFTEMQQEKSSPVWFTLFLDALWITGLGLFIYLTVSFQKAAPAAADYILFVKIVLVALLMVTLQRFFHSLTGVLFDMKTSFHRFIQVKDGHLQWASVLLVLFVLLRVYSPLKSELIIYLGLAFLALIYIIGVVRASMMAVNKNLNGLQLFFYLCALEILPVITVVKMVVT